MQQHRRVCLRKRATERTKKQEKRKQGGYLSREHDDLEDMSRVVTSDMNTEQEKAEVDRHTKARNVQRMSMAQ